VEEVQEIKEVKQELKKHTLRGIFEDFKNTQHKDLKTAFINLKEEIDEYLIEAKREDLQDDLALLEAEKQDFASSLVNIRETHKRSCFELQKQQEQLDIQLAKVNSLEETCKKEEEFLYPWQDFYDYLNDATQDVQGWIKEYTQPKQDDCNGCCKSGKDLKKPSWMDVNYFNLLKEIFG
jgi:predicted nuclease with TOPRIM domain